MVNIVITLFSSLYCKLYFCISSIFAPISPVLNVYISIERYMSIAYPTKKYFLLKSKIQLAYICVLALFNLLLYVPIGIYFDLISVENQTVCNYVNLFWQETYDYIDLTNRIIIPSLLMIIFLVVGRYDYLSIRFFFDNFFLDTI